MNVLFDTDVVLDALLDREPWAEPAVGLFDRVEAGGLIGHLGATTVTTIHYIARRNVGTVAADEMMKDLLRLFEVAPVNRAVLAGATAVVTRDSSGFSAAALRVYAPDTLLAALETAEEDQ